MQSLNKIISIDDLNLFKNLKNQKNYILAFITACIAGFIAYGFNMSNGYVNGDGLVYGYQYSAGAWDIGQGRWALPFFSGRFLSSWYEGILCILVLAVSASIVIVFLSIESVAAIMIISALIATQTHFAQWQGSPYILFPYAMAFMLAILSSWLLWMALERDKIDFFALSLSGIFSLAISMGIYQAYLPVSVLLVYIKIMQEVAKGTKYKTLFMTVVKIIVLYAMTGVIYFICMQVQMKRYNATATGGRGWADVLSGNLNILSNPIGTIKEIYWTFGQLLCINGLINFSMLHNIVYILIAVVVVACFASWCISNKNIIRCIILGIMGLGIPVVVMLLMILTDTVIPWSMFPAIIFIPILSIWIERRNSKRNGKFQNIIQWVSSICCIFLIMESVYIGNVDYINLQKRSQKTYAQCIRLLDRIETSEDYIEGIPILIVGSLQDTYPNTIQGYEKKLKGYEAYIMDWLVYPENNSRLYIQYISQTLGVQLVVADNYNERYASVIDADWFREMEAFPSMKCVKKYDDILVLKLSE